MAEQKTPAWQRVLAARATGQEVDPADIEEARAASRPGTVGWAARVAARAIPGQQTRPQLSVPAEGQARFRAAILARLNREHGDGPDAA